MSPESAIRLFARAVGILPAIVESFFDKNEELRDAPGEGSQQEIDTEIDDLLAAKFAKE